MRKLLILIALFSLVTTAHAQKQGIKGQVFWVSGNQMPGPDKLNKPQQGVVREIHIYQATTLQQGIQQEGFFSTIPTVLVSKVTSKSDGCFKVKLPAGNYSVFVKEEKGLFANRYDSNGCINCIVVKPKKYSSLTITVDYLAAY